MYSTDTVLVLVLQYIYGTRTRTRTWYENLISRTVCQIVSTRTRTRTRVRSCLFYHQWRGPQSVGTPLLSLVSACRALSAALSLALYPYTLRYYWTVRFNVSLLLDGSMFDPIYIMVSTHQPPDGMILLLYIIALQLAAADEEFSYTDSQCTKAC